MSQENYHHHHHCFVFIFCFVIIIIIINFSSMQDIYNYIPETVFLGYIVLQLFCSYNLWYMYYCYCCFCSCCSINYIFIFILEMYILVCLYAVSQKYPGA
jgi:hypothetical protein